MNNKGQTLISFVLLIPIILLILYMVYEVGRMSLLKNELDNINYLAVDYGIKHISDDNLEENIRELIIKNKNDIDNIAIVVDEGKIYVTLRDKLEGQIFKKMNIFSVKSTYIGYIEDNKKVIERDK